MLVERGRKSVVLQIQGGQVMQACLEDTQPAKGGSHYCMGSLEPCARWGGCALGTGHREGAEWERVGTWWKWLEPTRKQKGAIYLSDHSLWPWELSSYWPREMPGIRSKEQSYVTSFNTIHSRSAGRHAGGWKEARREIRDLSATTSRTSRSRPPLPQAPHQRVLFKGLWKRETHT